MFVRSIREVNQTIAGVQGSNVQVRLTSELFERKRERFEGEELRIRWNRFVCRWFQGFFFQINAYFLSSMRLLCYFIKKEVVIHLSRETIIY